MLMCRVVMPLVSGAFGCLLVLAVVASGLTMVVAPEAAKRLLKNAAIALGLFVLGSLVLNYVCEAGR